MEHELTRRAEIYLMIKMHEQDRYNATCSFCCLEKGNIIRIKTKYAKIVQYTSHF